MVQTLSPALPLKRERTVARVAPLSTSERVFFSVAFGLLLLLKIAYAFHFRIDSDEPQHLHTVWGWATGRLPYRDLFDNHMPLFQLLCAPLFRAIGETARIVAFMRLAMIPLFAAMLWCVYALASRFHSARVGFWAALLTGYCASFFFVSTEFRTDDLWGLVWLLALVLLLGKPLTTARSAGFGLLVGIAFAVSMKSSLLLGTLIFSALVVLSMERLLGSARPAFALMRCGAVALCCGLLAPAGVAAYFYWSGAWSEFVYCVFQHNMVPGVVETGGVPAWGRPFYFPCGLPLLLAATWWMLKRGFPPRQALVALAAGSYLLMLWSYWPILSAEDYEPFFPMLFAALVPLVWERAEALGGTRHAGTLKGALLLAIALFGRAWIVVAHHPWHNDAEPDQKIVADVLNLTRPEEFVMDGKADSIFRPRPFYFIMETMTDARLERGLIRDDSAERMKSTQPHVVLLNRLPGEARHFALAHYVQVGPRLLVPGKRLTSQAGGSAGANRARFEIAIPARYALISADASKPADLDGKPFANARWLDAGEHTLEWRDSSGQVLLWEDAMTKGYRPWETHKKRPEQ